MKVNLRSRLSESSFESSSCSSLPIVDAEGAIAIRPPAVRVSNVNPNVHLGLSTQRERQIIVKERCRDSLRYLSAVLAEACVSLALGQAIRLECDRAEEAMG